MQTQCDTILEALHDAKGAWVPMPHLARVSESLNIHSRIDELRHKRGMDIRNKQERDECNRKLKHSFYRIPVAEH